MGATSVWLTATETNATATNLIARLEHLPQTPESFTYDADGNLTSDGLRTYTWDAENRLLAVEIRTNVVTDARHWLRVTFDYDHQHRRIRKRAWKWNPAGETYYLSTSHRFFYDDWNLIGQIDEIIGDRMSFLWGADLSGTLRGAGGVGGLVAVVVHGGVQPGSYFSNNDHNGNVVALIDSESGSEAARYEYGPFGEEIRATGVLAKENPFRFSTKFKDNESGLLYYGNRYYISALGRWLSRDTLQELESLNLIAFIGNNMISSIDPDGRAVLETVGVGTLTTATMSSGGTGVTYTIVAGGSAATGWLVGGVFVAGVGTAALVAYDGYLAVGAISSLLEAEQTRRLTQMMEATLAGADLDSSRQRRNGVKTVDPKTCCTFIWHYDKRGGNKEHDAYTTRKFSPDLELTVVAKDGDSAGFDAGSPFPVVNTVYEAKTGRRWALGIPREHWITRWRNTFDGDMGQFSNQMRVAAKCKLKYRIYWKEFDGLNGYQKHAPEFAGFYVYSP